MAFCYKKLWHQLIDHDMSRTDLRDATGMAPATLAKLSKGEAVGTSILVRICDALGCGIRDIVDSVPRKPRRAQKEFCE
ncbi:MAG: helix-turn-helix transcriptional regulator [Kiritimatiellae bacterium]|nr:helix-turn-helix transcriptional regulator [Kiritimatiellia bacterium]